MEAELHAAAILSTVSPSYLLEHILSGSKMATMVARISGLYKSQTLAAFDPLHGSPEDHAFEILWQQLFVLVRFHVRLAHQEHVECPLPQRRVRITFGKDDFEMGGMQA